MNQKVPLCLGRRNLPVYLLRARTNGSFHRSLACRTFYSNENPKQARRGKNLKVLSLKRCLRSFDMTIYGYPYVSPFIFNRAAYASKTDTLSKSIGKKTTGEEKSEKESQLRASHSSQSAVSSPIPPLPSPSAVVAAGSGTFVGMCSLTAVDAAISSTTGTEFVVLIAPMAASAALIFGAPVAPFSQPRNVIGGHFVSATFGALTYKLICAYPVLKPVGGAFAATGSVVLMMLTGCLHPPSAATGLLGVVGPEWIKECGLLYGAQSAIGASVMVVTGLLINNLIQGKKYPTYW